MSINASVLRRLAALNLPDGALSEVLCIIADMQSSDDARKEKDRERKRKAAGKSAEVPRKEDGNSEEAPEPSRADSNIHTRAPVFPVVSSLRSETVIIPPKGPPNNPKAVVAAMMASAFERFWDAWPHKVGKPAAARSFAKVWRDVDAIIAGVERYERHKPPDRPWLNPSTFLNQRRWEDQPAAVAPAGEPSRRPSNRDGVGKLLAEIYGGGRENETSGNPETLRLLSVDDGVWRSPDSGDDGGLFADPRRLFGSGSG
jgi:hypothetical protein